MCGLMNMDFKCFDYANAGWKVLFGLLLKRFRCKRYTICKRADGLATVYQNTPDFWHNPATWLYSVAITVQGYTDVAWVIETTQIISLYMSRIG